MSLKCKVCVVLGASGTVGQGACVSFLQEGATLVAVSRDQGKADALKKKLIEVTKVDGSHIIALTGDFSSEKAAYATAEKVAQTLSAQHLKIDHIVSGMGYFDFAQYGPTGTSSDVLRKTLEDNFYPTYEAARQFLPMLKDREGSSYTVLSGGLAHFTPMVGLWMATAKNALTNGLSHGLGTETADWKVRFNTFCIHFGIAEMDAQKNKSGMDGVDTRKVGPVFVAFANSKVKGTVVCGNSAEHSLELASKFPK